MQPAGSASEIAALEATVEANGGWNSSLQTIYDGIALGQTTVAELQNAVDSINITSTSAAETVFYWYFELSKFGVPINATTIEAALNEMTMLPSIGGLPDDYSNSGTASFSSTTGTICTRINGPTSWVMKHPNGTLLRLHGI